MTWLKKLGTALETWGSHRGAAKARRGRLTVEALEDRLLMSSGPVTGEFITYRLASGGVFRLAATPGAQPENISQESKKDVST